MGGAEIDQFLSHLAKELQLGADSQNQAASLIAFLYRELYGWDLAARDGITRAKEPHLLPKYAPPGDVDRFMAELHQRQRIDRIRLHFGVRDGLHELGMRKREGHLLLIEQITCSQYHEDVASTVATVGSGSQWK